jgi:RHS repeat-associated protein
MNQRLGTFQYGYESRGNIASITEANKSRIYSYNALERLTKVEQSSPAPQPATTVESYTLDNEGNRIASHLSAFHLTDPTNRLVEDQQYVYEYNADGLTTRKTTKSSGETWRYTYDAFDGLQKAWQYDSPASTNPLRIMEYRNDAVGRRIYVEAYGNTFPWSAPNEFYREEFVYDGDNVYRYEWRDTAIVPTPPIPRRQWFTQGGVDNLLALTTADPALMQNPATRDTAGPQAFSFSYNTDHQGSVRTITDPNGSIVAEFDYDSFGNVTTSIDFVDQPFRWHGRERDGKTGLYHFRARVYDAKTGRFLQEDPLHFDAGDLNVFNFVLSNPINKRDPYGLIIQDAAVRKAVATAAVVGSTVIGSAIACYLLIPADALGQAQDAYESGEYLEVMKVIWEQCGVISLSRNPGTSLGISKRKKKGKPQKYRNCTALEMKKCINQCGDKGVMHCRFPQRFLVTRLKSTDNTTLIMRSWVDGPLDCSCKFTKDDR